MIKVTVNYNKGFDIVPDGNVNVSYDAYIEDDQLTQFINSLDTVGVQTINVTYNVEVPEEQVESDGSDEVED